MLVLNVVPVFSSGEWHGQWSSTSKWHGTKRYKALHVFWYGLCHGCAVDCATGVPPGWGVTVGLCRCATGPFFFGGRGGGGGTVGLYHVVPWHAYHTNG